MGRSSQEKAQENRARILQNASQLFRQHGVENVSIADVMAACGMTVGGFYKHFASKDALAAEVCATSFAQALSTWDGVYDQADAADQPRLATLVQRYIHNRAPQRRCPILAFAPAIATGGAAEPTIQAYATGTQALFDKFLLGQGEPAAAATTADARVLFAAMVGARLLHQALGHTDWVDGIEAAVIAAATPAPPPAADPRNITP
jgi:TetR/AcrR family transcriptional repressor of nem operon